jgi:hypothetical protein
MKSVIGKQHKKNGMFLKAKRDISLPNSLIQQVISNQTLSMNSECVLIIATVGGNSQL